MIWKIEYDNDTGPNDESFSEWWCVTDGVRSFKADSKEDANFLLSLLNASPPQQEQAAPGAGIANGGRPMTLAEIAESEGMPMAAPSAVPDDVVKDAQRYRWLRKQPNDTAPPRIDVVSWESMDEAANSGDGLRLDKLDAAIDAAMLKEGK